MWEDVKKPNLFIIGAPKCGTTALSEYLREHPEVFFSKPKEPNYFSEEFFVDHRLFKNERQYLKVFRGAANYKVVGEGSTSYLISESAVPNILKFNSDAKFIVMVRNPIEMAYSLHSQLLFSGAENEPDFEKAWRLQEKRANGESIPKHCIEPQFLQYGKICKLGEQIKRLFGVVDPSKVLIIVHDEFKKNPRDIYLRVLNFLVVKDDGRTDFPPVNANKRIKYKPLFNFLQWLSFVKRKANIQARFGILNKLALLNERYNSVKYTRKELRKEFIDDLRKYFADDVKLLSKYLNKDLTYWINGK